jgi:hypothetical protein
MQKKTGRASGQRMNVQANARKSESRAGVTPGHINAFTTSAERPGLPLYLVLVGCKNRSLDKLHESISRTSWVILHRHIVCEKHHREIHFQSWAANRKICVSAGWCGKCLCGTERKHIAINAKNCLFRRKCLIFDRKRLKT